MPKRKQPKATKDGSRTAAATGGSGSKSATNQHDMPSSSDISEKKRRITKENSNEPKFDILQMKNEISHHLLVNNGNNSNNNKNNKYNQLEESGYVETKLLPFFIHLLLLSQNTKEEEEEDYESILHPCAYLIALLINQRFYSSRGITNSNKMNNKSNDDDYELRLGPLSLSHYQQELKQLEELQHDDNEKVDIFESFIYYLLGYNHDNNNDDDDDDDGKDNQKKQNKIQKLKIESTKLQFFINTFTSSSTSTSATSSTSFIHKIINIGLWTSMSNRYRQLLLSQYPNYKQKWLLYCNHLGKKSNDVIKRKAIMDKFIPDIVQLFLSTLQNVGNYIGRNRIEQEKEELNIGEKVEESEMEFLHIVLQFFIDLLSTTATRRYLRPYLLSNNFSVHCTISKLFKSFLSASSSTTTTLLNNEKYKSQSVLFVQLVVMLQDLETFSIQDVTAAPLSKSNMASLYHNRAHTLQKIVHIHYKDEFEELIYAGVGMVCDYTFLKKNLDRIGDVSVLYDVAHRLRLLDMDNEVTEFGFKNENSDDKDGGLREFVTEVLLYHHTLRPTAEQTLSQLPLYPDEKLLWNPHLVPPGHTFMVGKTLALPKLNTQFLTFGDYLLRSFKLLRLESAYEIRSDIVDAIKRMRPVPRHDYNNGYEDVMNEEELWSMKRAKTEFHGWSRMALELTDNITCPVKLLKVSPPKLGECIPAQVLAEITLDLKQCGERIRNEWDEIREFDNLFLIAVDATKMKGGPGSVLESDEQNQERRIPDDEDVTFPQRFGIVAVRGCMVLQVRDSNGTIISDPIYTPQNDQMEDKNSSKAKDFKRYLTVALDTSQYAADATGSGSSMGIRVYQMLNVVVRRKGKENNFKAVLETIRGLMEGSGSINKSVPSWLQPVFLGYGDPSLASFTSPTMKTFATNTVGVTNPDSDLDYGDTFLDERHLRESFSEGTVSIDGKDTISTEAAERRKYRVKMITNSNDSVPVISASSYPFPKGINGNPVRFTPMQVKAIQSGLNVGLTLIVGPPGTGKTDVAVQIIANLYHSFPSQRTVLVTHSNAALNDLFAKVMARGDVDERYMLRLGSGERDLETNSDFDFTKQGRVNHLLSRRAKLLEEVQLLSESIGISGAGERGSDGSPSYTCETAEYFNLHHVKKRVHIFYSKLTDNNNKSEIGSLFPFKKYFDINDDKLTLDEAKKHFAKLGEYFTELEEYRPLELLRSQRQRIDYLLTKQARIVAMTCTHAAIARSHLVELGFQYDNIIMEEAGQMLDIETFVPLLLQRGQMSMESRLKRICLIGDHNQLPPVVKNVSFSRYSNLDQSLFSRLIRLGVPSIDLNKQGRSRPNLASLYSWRYRDLGNLEHVNNEPEFLNANAGFSYTNQIINVEDYEGRGESTPTAYFYQNVGEAEYAVALFQFMVLIGYPPEKISILTTYNGQKELLNDIIAQRCGEDTPLGGVRPGAISTVDHYQGQQNDYIILSLVRTKSIGHLRDIRRLVVAVSRARLGLYVLCRHSLFSQCHELKNVFDQYQDIPKKLELVMGEQYPTERSLKDEVSSKQKYIVDDVISLGNIVHGMQEQLCQNNTPT